MAKDKEKEKPKTFDALLKSINKSLGNGTIGLGTNLEPVRVFSTGVASIDVALGCLGIPRGRIIEIWGAESSGKTTTTLQIAKACQQYYFEDKQRYGVVVFIDVEHALDKKWAKAIGVDIDKWAFSQPDTGEDVFRIIEECVDSGQVDLIIVDSVAALVPKKIIDGDIGDQTMGAHAQLMSRGLGKIKGKCNISDTTVIFINQVREKVGLVFGDPSVTPGGRALKFYSSIRAEVKRKEGIKMNKDVLVGNLVHLTIKKNKVAPPFAVAEYEICFGKKERPVYGIDELDSMVKVAVDTGAIQKVGNFLSFESQTIANGHANTVELLRRDKEYTNKIREKLYTLIAKDMPPPTENNQEEPEDLEESEEALNNE